MKSHSLKRWITRCFVLIILFSVLSLCIWDISQNYRINHLSRFHRALGCSELIDAVFEPLDFNSLDSDKSEEYLSARNALRAICQSFGLDYIYVYTIDRETEYRHFIFCTANEDDKDEIVSRERSLGAVSTAPLHPEEALILNGDVQVQKREVNNKFGNEVVWFVPS